MSTSNNQQNSLESHLRVTKTKSDNGGGGSNSNSGEDDRNGRASSSPTTIQRSTSNAMVENLRDVRFIGNGYRRSIDLLARPESNLVDASLAASDRSKIDDDEQQRSNSASSPGDDGSTADEKGKGSMKDIVHSTRRDESGSSAMGTTQAIGRPSVGDQEDIVGLPVNKNVSSMSSVVSTTTSSAAAASLAAHQRALAVAPYHVSRVAAGQQQQSPSPTSPSSQVTVLSHQASAPSLAAMRYQPPSQTTTVVMMSQQRQSSQPPPLLPQRQEAQFLSRPATFARLTRNGPFCPCFSPNDSDTEPSSPVAETAMSSVIATSSNSAGATASVSQGRNMATLARELRARFVVNPGGGNGGGGSTRGGGAGSSHGVGGGSQAERFSMSMRGRGTAGEAINVVAEPYPVQIHTAVEYTHYLVPDLLDITRAPYYWGVMDRFEAERLLDNQPEGTFLLRDSAQSEYLFSVSFRRYGRTLHARIEQLNHKFSFDSYDQGVFSADTVTGLIEHYKDPSKFMFFEPQLSVPLPRNFVFPLQHLCRSVIASRINYNGINQLELPKKFKDYLREYHYKHPVRVTKLE